MNRLAENTHDGQTHGQYGTLGNERVVKVKMHQKQIKSWHISLVLKEGHFREKEATYSSHPKIDR